MRTRNLKELLQLTLDEGNKLREKPKSRKKFYFIGLCGFVNYYLYILTTARENVILLDFIKKNRPKTTSPGFHGTRDYSIGYFWPVGEWEPRKLWLEDQIKNIQE